MTICIMGRCTVYEKLKSPLDLLPIIESGQTSPVQVVYPYGRRIYESDNARVSHSVSIYIYPSLNYKVR